MPTAFDKFAPAGAAWIWSDRVKRPYHHVVAFRRAFELRSTFTSAQLHITADARYEVHVNGTWLGFGPVRAWQSPWSVDTYEIGHLLREGPNVIAVLVQHPGLSTFQYIEADAGLIAMLEFGSDQQKAIVTDRQWRCTPHIGHAWPVPRVSCMQPWEEQFDARPIGEWTQAGFDDAAWDPAMPMHAAGDGPHERFESRDIPFLTREPISPTRLLAVEAVRAAPITWSLNPRDLLNAHDKTAEHVRGLMLLVTHLFSDGEQKIQFHPPHGRPATHWKLNGEALTFDDHSLQKTDTGVAHATLRAGWNTLMARLPEEEHYWWAILNAWPEQSIRPAARPDAGSDAAPTAWLAAGPFGDAAAKSPPPPSGWNIRMVDPQHIEPDATTDRFEAIWKRGALTADEFDADFVRPLTTDMVAAADV
jgi:alpha-L-rhamnosidase